MLKHRLEDESRARATADSRILEVGGLHYKFRGNCICLIFVAEKFKLNLLL